MNNYNIQSMASTINQKYHDLNEEAKRTLKEIIESRDGFINLTTGDWYYTYSYDNCFIEATECRLTAVSIKDGFIIVYYSAITDDIPAGSEYYISDDDIRQYCEWNTIDGGSVLQTQTLCNIFEKLMYDF